MDYLNILERLGSRFCGFHQLGMYEVSKHGRFKSLRPRKVPKIFYRDRPTLELSFRDASCFYLRFVGKCGEERLHLTHRSGKGWTDREIQHTKTLFDAVDIDELADEISGFIFEWRVTNITLPALGAGICKPPVETGKWRVIPPGKGDKEWFEYDPFPGAPPNQHLTTPVLEVKVEPYYSFYCWFYRAGVEIFYENSELYFPQRRTYPQRAGVKAETIALEVQEYIRDRVSVYEQYIKTGEIPDSDYE